jgi:hypothetical protein
VRGGFTAAAACLEPGWQPTGVSRLRPHGLQPISAPFVSTLCFRVGLSLVAHSTLRPAHAAARPPSVPQPHCSHACGPRLRGPALRPRTRAASACLGAAALPPEPFWGTGRRRRGGLHLLTPRLPARTARTPKGEPGLASPPGRRAASMVFAPTPCLPLRFGAQRPHCPGHARAPGWVGKHVAGPKRGPTAHPVSCGARGVTGGAARLGP